MIIQTINKLNDIKKLSLEELHNLAGEMREGILKRTSVVGGHVAPNLGVVELTIALHYVFDLRQDKIVYDTSHQAYCHKMLSGRWRAFFEKEFFDSITGFTNPNECESDLFSLGHTSTSIGLATGLAIQRDYNNGAENIIAVIGDSSLDGGPALEALNYLGSLNTGIIVVVNDNNQSIAENYGAICNQLNMLKESNGILDNNIFKALGFDYMLVKDGHNINHLIDVLQTVKGTHNKVLLHVCTVKGKGYKYAEQDKETWHATRPYDINSGDFLTSVANENYGSIFREYIIDKINCDKRCVLVQAAMPYVIGFNNKELRRRLGDRYIDVGIAESNAILTCSGIAKMGGKPIFATVASFYQRAYDEIMQEICVNSLPVTMIVTHASVYGINDETHFGLYDISMLGNIPGLTYMAPTSKEEYLSMLDWSIGQEKEPVAIRVPWAGVFHSNYEIINDYDTKSCKTTQCGSRVAIIAVGSFYQMGEEVASLYESRFGSKATLINPRFIGSTVDEKSLDALKDKHELIVTIEDGILVGGFGSKIAQHYSATDIKVKNYGFRLPIPNLYDAKDLMRKNRLVPEMILQDIANCLD